MEANSEVMRVIFKEAIILPVFESTYDKRMYDIRGDNCRIWCDPIECYNIHFNTL